MLTLKQTIKTGHNNVTGCCIMSNGVMVFTKYYSEEVTVLHKDGSMGFTIDIRSGNPCHVTCIDNNNIAVSVEYGDNQVHMIVWYSIQ
jgi:hypothetical protein